jgi:hypothetical protein
MTEEPVRLQITAPPGPALARLGILGSALGTALDTVTSVGGAVGGLVGLGRGGGDEEEPREKRTIHVGLQG